MFQPGEGPSRSLLCDCENDGSFAVLSQKRPLSLLHTQHNHKPRAKRGQTGRMQSLKCSIWDVGCVNGDQLGYWNLPIIYLLSVHQPCLPASCLVVTAPKLINRIRLSQKIEKKIKCFFIFLIEVSTNEPFGFHNIYTKPFSFSCYCLGTA